MALEIDRVGSLLIRTAMFARVLVYHSECIAIDHATHADHDLAFAICDKAGVGVKMKCNRIVDGSGKMSFPILVIDGLTLRNQGSKANKAGD